ncbi:MAG: Zn-ribbon domain-containing OB-fold protein [Reyranellaceae bacterium]
MQIVPRPDPLTAPYWEGARQGRLLIQRCLSCGQRWHPPAPFCPACQSDRYAWEAVSGRGTVFSFTVVHHAAHVAVAGKVPYLVALVELEEGVRLVANIRNCPMQDVSIGMKVGVAFEPLTPEITLPQFQPRRD